MIAFAFTATLINCLDRQALSVAAPVLREQFGMTNTTYSRVVFAFLLACTVMNGLSGPLIGRGARVSATRSARPEGAPRRCSTLSPAARGAWARFMGSGFGGMLFTLITGPVVDRAGFTPVFFGFGLLPLISTAILWRLTAPAMKG